MAGRRAWERDTHIERDLIERLTNFRLKALNQTGSRAFTYTELARQSHGVLSIDNIYQWERGVCLPSTMAQWQAWASVLGLELTINLK